MPKKKKRRPLKSLKKLQPSIPEVSRFKLGDKPISFHEIKDLTPVFAFNYISLRKTNKCFNCDDIAQKTYHKFFKRLKNISRVYFRELIEGGSAIRFHHIDFNDERVKIMVSDFREALTPKSQSLDDENTPELYQFSIGGEKRIFGFLGKLGIFYLVWFDHSHSIYG